MDNVKQIVRPSATFMRRWQANRASTAAACSAHVIWAKRHPALDSAFFDKHFVKRQLVPLLRRGEQTPEELANLWAAQFSPAEGRTLRWAQQVLPAMRDYLYLYSGELRFYEQRQQRSPWWNRRAFQRQVKASSSY